MIERDKIACKCYMGIIQLQEKEQKGESKWKIE